MPQCSQPVPASFCRPEWAITKLVRSSLMGMWLLTGSPSFCAAHCSQRCFSIFFPLLISVRCTVAGLLQLSHFIRAPPKTVCGMDAAPQPPAISTANRISAVVQRQTKYGTPQAPTPVPKSRPVDGRILVRLPDFDTHDPHAVRHLMRERPADVKRDVFRRRIQLGHKGLD